MIKAAFPLTVNVKFSPLPVSATVKGDASSFARIVRTPLRAPAWLGVNVRLTGQLEPTGRLVPVPHCPAPVWSAKSPVTVGVRFVNVTPPVLLNVITCGVLVSVTREFPKLIDPAEAAIPGADRPVPESETTSG